MTRTKPIMTMPSVEPTSDLSPTDGVGVVICMESEAALKFFAETVGWSKFVAATSTKISTIIIKAIPKI